MSLLTDLMEHPLDPGYQAAADRRAASGGPARSGGLRSPLVIVTCVLIGLLLIAAAQTLRLPQDAADRQRQQLVDQIHGQQKAIDGKTRTISDLQHEISDAQRRVLDQGSGVSVAEQLERVELASGAVAVHGPGVKLTLDDAPSNPDADEQSNSEEESSITSSDLQILTNGFWQAGAEAISINGQRLTSTSSIRFAGPAITIDFRPIARPYVVSAIGEPGGMRKRFEEGPSGDYLKALPSQIDIRVKMDDADRLSVPASSSSVLQYARTASTKTATGSTSTQKETP
ncbi:DUF881 domain-containing protein [Luteipulveratus sp. YIM 133296]|uniref:DUF881 domain-containing protein n=2 Tax=Luteipulveratus flavus TaxID=3031728 RepID=A0ABT6CBH8_9MICO|nr:DUF881 domain-containing protein [Luteipulveratus sp. YIM 133296]